MATTASMQQFIRERVQLAADTGCWIWQRKIEYHGYGRAKFDGRAQYAHRISYEAFVGTIPEGLQLDHLCRVKACVNPAHLEPVTCKENIGRSRRATKTHCVNGHEYAAGHLEIRGGRRACRTCRYEQRRRRDAAKAVSA